jgi:predicted RNase H-like nuclease
MIRLFQLNRIISYKKGPPAERRVGLHLLHGNLRELAAADHGLKPSECLDALLGTDLATRRGAALKRHEDLLDAVFCAYLAWHFWRWGQERNEVFGDLRTGYIVLPKPLSPSIPDTP